MRLHRCACAAPHAVQNGARSLRICACATPEAATPAKKFSAGGQAAQRSSQTPRRVAGAQCLRMCLNGMHEKNSAKEVLFKKPLRKRLCECGVGDRRQRRFASPLADAWRHQTEKYLQKSVDSKKSVIRFRPADIAAEESEQNRHQADTLVPDVHRSTINGGVGFASLQKTQRSFRSRTRVAVRCGCFCIRPVAHHLRTVPDDGMPSRGLLQLGVFQLHSSLTRSQTHGHH